MRAPLIWGFWLVEDVHKEGSATQAVELLLRSVKSSPETGRMGWGRNPEGAPPSSQVTQWSSEKSRASGDVFALEDQWYK